MATKTHKGPLVECPVCSGVQPERKFRRKKTTGLTAEISVRRQATAELGEEPTRFQKDAVFQKYGIHDPVIDRNVKKPSWKSEVVWKNELKQFHQMTEGLVPSVSRNQFFWFSSLNGAELLLHSNWFGLLCF